LSACQLLSTDSTGLIQDTLTKEPGEEMKNCSNGNLTSNFDEIEGINEQGSLEHDEGSAKDDSDVTSFEQDHSKDDLRNVDEIEFPVDPTTHCGNTAVIL
jgi:hypothetical protein